MFGGIVILALLVWGMFKYAGAARQPSVNATCARSLVIALGSWAVSDVSVVARRATEGPLSAEGTVLTGVVAFVSLAMSVVAIVFAVRGLRELDRRRVAGELELVRGRGMAKWAIALSGLMLFLALGGAVWGAMEGGSAPRPRKVRS